MIYSINKGNHYSFPRWPHLHLSKGKEVVEVTFNESNLYCFNDANQLDVNKLHGRTFGWDIHNNSYRIGWRTVGSYIELLHYTYVNEHRVIKVFDMVNINKKIVLPIDYNNVGGYIKVGDSLTDFNTSNMPNWGFRSFPYFGGNKCSPNNMRIELFIH